MRRLTSSAWACAWRWTTPAVPRPSRGSIHARGARAHRNAADRRSVMLPAMRIDFTKMHGLGNDFLVLDLPAEAPLPTSAQWRALSDRHTGVGFDQALVLQPARRSGTD